MWNIAQTHQFYFWIAQNVDKSIVVSLEHASCSFLCVSAAGAAHRIESHSTACHTMPKTRLHYIMWYFGKDKHVSIQFNSIWLLSFMAFCCWKMEKTEKSERQSWKFPHWKWLKRLLSCIVCMCVSCPVQHRHSILLLTILLLFLLRELLKQIKEQHFSVEQQTDKQILQQQRLNSQWTGAVYSSIKNKYWQ